MDARLEPYRVVVSFLGEALGPDYEVVLHDLTSEDGTIVAIVNNHISGRTEGAPLSNMALGFIKGEVCPLGPDLADKELKVPQMGWNALHIVKDDPLFRYIREGEYVYYVHSYYGKNCAESTLAVSDYSIPVTGAVRAGRVYGTQFHPEKSGDTGLRILKAFAEL